MPRVQFIPSDCSSLPKAGTATQPEIYSPTESMPEFGRTKKSILNFATNDFKTSSQS